MQIKKRSSASKSGVLKNTSNGTKKKKIFDRNLDELKTDEEAVGNKINGEKVLKANFLNSFDYQHTFFNQVIPSIKETKKQKINSFLNEVYGMPFSNDFVQFWKFCLELCPENPCSIFEKLGSNNTNLNNDQYKDLKLVGPFEVLEGKFESYQRKDLFLHYRYLYDVPEFLTIINGKYIHYGIYRTNPKHEPDFIVSAQNNSSFKNFRLLNCKINPICSNIFQLAWLVYQFLTKNSFKEHLTDKVSYEKETFATKFYSLLNSYARKLRISLDKKTFLQSYNKHKKLASCTTFNKIGLVVPVKNGVGYRPLPYTNSQLLKILTRMNDEKQNKSKNIDGKDLEILLNDVKYADDEGDIGMGLELGINLFCSFRMFDNAACHLLKNAYKFLDRNIYAAIIALHIEYRDRTHLNIFFEK